MWATAVLLVLLIIVALTSYRKPYTVSEPEIVKKIFHQMSRWSTASTQDVNPIVKVLHANYGVGFMMALQSITSDEALEKILEVNNIRGLFSEVENIQHKATIELVKKCPVVAPTTMLAKYDSEGI
jgi:hypothetical protein